MPAPSIASVTASETSGTWSANAAEPNVVRTPAVRLRSLIAVGTPNSGDAVRPAPGDRPPAPGRARQLGRERDERADRVESVGAFEVVLGELERRHLTASDELALLQGGQVVQVGHAPDA